MAVSEAHKRASAKWNGARDAITIRPEKETGAAIRAAAAGAGLSVQAWILSQLAPALDRPAAPDQPEE